MPPSRSTRNRTRVERSIIVDQDAPEFNMMEKVRAVGPSLMDALIEDAKSDPEARKELLKWLEDDVMRARGGQASEVLKQLAAVRAKGSKILQDQWMWIVKNTMYGDKR